MITTYKGHIIKHNIKPTDNDQWVLNVKIYYWYSFFKCKTTELTFTIDLNAKDLFTRKKALQATKKMIDEMEYRLKA